MDSAILAHCLLMSATLTLEITMLVLTRKLNESIRIDNDIELTVLEVRGNRVRLGIVAPRSVDIRRTGCEFETEVALASTKSRESTSCKRNGSRRRLPARASQLLRR